MPDPRDDTPNKTQEPQQGKTAQSPQKAEQEKPQQQEEQLSPTEVLEQIKNDVHTAYSASTNPQVNKCLERAMENLENIKV